jgi:hypothetical protein
MIFLLENFLLLKFKLISGRTPQIMGSKNAQLPEETREFSCLQSYRAKRFWKGRNLRMSAHPEKVAYPRLVLSQGPRTGQDY